MYGGPPRRERQADYPDRLGGTVPPVTGGSVRRNHRRGRAQSSDLANGQQDHNRFRDDDEQGPRSDRGALAVRFARRKDRCRDSSAERYPFDGRNDRRVGYRGNGDHGYGDSGGVRARVSGSIAARSSAAAFIY